ncbi:AraC family transcriptional regulator [Comamonas thiooxydans]|uniref:AraC family transcriptional regulator n=1 Tax=Comamonas thiooxydans TaxID=363952 RepID=A0AA42Q105_9BURK|nr:AraC family transcriptional regulator [Comamonas thiooxydans]MDH1335155.1 AraC family transcriptional regulator [Comamonas thiooxydans]MDH1475675.1 AraC family transcriptional regulator [Comamonas thiooxydans]MDH1740633.1 AraC family transcriptional regulator [Comamonas thiooxydans]MDH1786891.1 AraC family transcriptional regulator [Comamonas thiooxydans]
MSNTPIIDVAAFLPSRPLTEHRSWPAWLQRCGAHMTRDGLHAFSSHSYHPERSRLRVCDSEGRLHLSVWLQDGIEVDRDGWKFRVEGRDIVAGYLPEATWQTDFAGYAHQVGLLLPLDLLHDLADEQGADFFHQLQRDACLRVRPGDADILRAAHELDAVLLDSESSALLREAKSLELLARMVGAGTRPVHGALTPGDRARLVQAREILLADLSKAPSIPQLARACGLNTFRLKQGFKTMFGGSIHGVYQQERMQAAWTLIASEKMTATEAGHHVGYSNMSHFGVAFRKVFGVLPSEVKRRTLLPFSRK